MAEEVEEALERLQEHAGKQLGDDEDPLLVSVRSGARESMPGMLDTVLNLGLNDTSVEGLARATDNERFAWDSYRRFVQMFGNVSRGIPGEKFEQAIKEIKQDRGVKEDTELDVDALKELTNRFKDLYDFPQEPQRAAPPGDPRRVRLLDRRAGRPVPAPQPDPRRMGHGGQRAADGVRQQGRHVRLRRRLQPRRGHGRARAVRRLPAQRPGRGRGVRRAQYEGHRRHEGVAARGARAADGDPAHARGPLQGHAGHRVHGRGGAVVHAPDPQRQAPRPGGRALRVRRRRRGPAHARRRRWRRSTRLRSTRCCTRPSIPRPTSTCSPPASTPPRGGEGRGGVHGGGRGQGGGGRPRRHPRAAVHGGRRRRRLPRRQGHPHLRGRQGLARGAGGARHGAARGGGRFGAGDRPRRRGSSRSTAPRSRRATGSRSTAPRAA